MAQVQGEARAPERPQLAMPHEAPLARELERGEAQPEGVPLVRKSRGAGVERGPAAVVPPVPLVPELGRGEGLQLAPHEVPLTQELPLEQGLPQQSLVPMVQGEALWKDQLLQSWLALTVRDRHGRAHLRPDRALPGHARSHGPPQVPTPQIPTQRPPAGYMSTCKSECDHRQINITAQKHCAPLVVWPAQILQQFAELRVYKRRHCNKNIASLRVNEAGYRWLQPLGTVFKPPISFELNEAQCLFSNNTGSSQDQVRSLVRELYEYVDLQKTFALSVPSRVKQ